MDAGKVEMLESRHTDYVVSILFIYLCITQIVRKAVMIFKKKAFVILKSLEAPRNMYIENTDIKK